MTAAVKPNRPDGIPVIAIYYLIMGVLNLIGACAIVVFPVTAIVRFNGGPDQCY
jgi:hypothetical protein